MRFRVTIGLVRIILRLLQLVDQLFEGIVAVLYERSENALAPGQAMHAT